MSERQAIIRSKIELAVRAANCDEILYRSEWLGYLPFGAYHWIECRGENITKDFPEDWSVDDLAGLERASFLEKIEEYQSPTNDFKVGMKYRVRINIVARNDRTPTLTRAGVQKAAQN
ncbi:MAG: hypothetical protein K8T25_21880 [Planctomycetia bacterium]|nr:hypothetical protein [Planctomycetia bacterium]